MRCAFQLVGKEVCSCSPRELRPLTHVLSPPPSHCYCPAWYAHLFPSPQLPGAPWSMSAPRLVHTVPLWWHLCVFYDKWFSLVTPFLLDLRSSGCEQCPDIIIPSVPGMWWHHYLMMFSEGKNEWMGSSTDSWVAFLSKLLLSSLPRHRPQANVMRLRMNHSKSKRTDRGVSA